MTTSQQAQSHSVIDQSSQKENLPFCAKFHLRTFNRCVKYSSGVIMDNYLVVLAQDDSIHWTKREDYDSYDLDTEEPAILLAFNLQDHTVQEVKMYADIFGYQQGYYNFLKYGENQIIKYGGDPEKSDAANMICITSKALEVKFEPINHDKERISSRQTAQIFQDCMYVYAKANYLEPVDELWSFDLRNHTWKLCETTGEGPPRLTKAPDSFIFEDHLCVYGGWNTKSPLGDLFLLNLNSMKWTKIEQEEKSLELKDEDEKNKKDDNEEKENWNRWNGTVYKDHLLTLKKQKNSEENILGSLSLRTKNTCSAFTVKDLSDPDREIKALTGGLMSYRNWILYLDTEDNDQNLIVAMINIENFGICPPKSTEEEYFSSLFLSQNESDIAFKIEEKVIPAHKQVLMKKSRYFDGLFNSGMAESTQDIIEIKDCEYDVFKEYLRWVYQGTVDLQDANQAINLSILADKYLQKGLHEKCLDVLTSRINMDDVITILNFAIQDNNLYLKSWCLKCVRDKLNIRNIAKFIQDLKKLNENNKKFRDQALLFILDNFFELYESEKGEMQIYEDFIIENIEINTVPALAHFLGRNPKKQRELFEDQDYYDYEGEDESEEKVKRRKGVIRRDHFEKCTVHLKEAVFRFIQENDKMIMESKMWKNFPSDFTKDLFLYTNENLKNALKNGNGKKRMEPSKDDFDGEESHELKKTKKSDAA